jgi:3'-5' exoribonuclease
MPKRQFVKDLKVDDRVDDLFVVASKSVGQTFRGSPFLKMKLIDKSGEIDAVKWDAADADIEKVAEDEVIQVAGKIGTYRDSPQIEVSSLQRAGKEVDPSDFVRSSPHDLAAMAQEFRETLAQVKQPGLAKLLAAVFDDEERFAAFCQAPAAKSMHHAYVGGLLEHTVSVMKTCSVLAQRYESVNKELLVAGAALHDIGKIDEFNWRASISYSDIGNFVGHIVSGAILVKCVADAIPELDEMAALQIEHMIIAHHGEKEFGSPKRPKTLEAMILHMADDLDAKLFQIEAAVAESRSRGEAGRFTRFVKGLDRPVYKGSANEPGSEPDSADLRLIEDEEYNPFEEER